MNKKRKKEETVESEVETDKENIKNEIPISEGKIDEIINDVIKEVEVSTPTPKKSAKNKKATKED